MTNEHRKLPGKTVCVEHIAKCSPKLTTFNKIKEVPCICKAVKTLMLFPLVPI